MSLSIIYIQFFLKSFHALSRLASVSVKLYIFLRYCPVNVAAFITVVDYGTGCSRIELEDVTAVDPLIVTVAAEMIVVDVIVIIPCRVLTHRDVSILRLPVVVIVIKIIRTESIPLVTRPSVHAL